MFGALEAGGTKMVCGIGDENGQIIDRLTIPTTTPEETLPKMAEYFRQFDLEAIGIGCFGPIDLNPASDHYGYITTTPKLAWKNTDIVGYFKRELGIPVAFDTDVNAACLGEAVYGAAKGCDSCVYITIGTGIGAGIMVDGHLLHGMMHPEAGHILLRKAKTDEFEGSCPYHKNCFEGLAAGPAIAARYHTEGSRLTDRADVWELEADYIAQALVNLTMVVSPKRIILGGGVMQQESLFPLIHMKFTAYLAGYINTQEVLNPEQYIVSAGLGGDQGLCGCLILARELMGQVK